MLTGCDDEVQLAQSDLSYVGFRLVCLLRIREFSTERVFRLRTHALCTHASWLNLPSEAVALFFSRQPMSFASVHPHGFDDLGEGPAFLALLADLETNGARTIPWPGWTAPAANTVSG